MSKVKIKKIVPQDSLIDKTVKSTVEEFPVVGIGASAGGIEALEQFFINVPVNSGMAFVVIQHLDPDRKAIMHELLQRFTEMPVFMVTDRMKVKPDSIYVIPPNKSMSILNYALHLFEPVETRGLRLPIDYFFRSLADDMREHSIGIILSGMGSDGSMGVRTIKENGGMVLVQEPETAKFDSMPRCAIETVIADIVAPVNELPDRLMALARRTSLSTTIQELEKDTSSLEKILILLRTHTGNDFSQYKKSTIYRRIERRMGIHQIGKIAYYVRYLQENPAELDMLFKELLIGVTNFFRDPDVWENLKNEVLQSIFDRTPDGHVLRVWIPGCSTGEEAYSIAMIFIEALEKTNPVRKLSMQIFATDLDSSAIEKARRGIYMANIIADVSPKRLNRFFIKTDDQYRITADLREMVVFAVQNMIKDPPFTKLDILSCRNLLIYLDAEIQKKLLALFHYSINPGGILILGSAETQSPQYELFTAINSKLRIYQHSDSNKPEEILNFPGPFYRSGKRLIENPLPVKVPDNLQTLTDQLLLQQFSPASVLVTDKGDILYITGSTGKYLEPAAGKANMNLFAMAREGLRDELSIAFRKATQNYEKIELRGIKLETDGQTKIADITIKQIEKPSSLKGKIIIIFTDRSETDLKSLKPKIGRTSKNFLKVELETELQHVKEDLQSVREEMLASQEELQSANEELQSTNEELQSTNEELTTSKEEMQSLNEELHTLNAELQRKVDDHERVNNDMNNLLNSIDIATLFLDRDLKIRQFTSPATKIFKLIPGDIGRVFTDQVTDLDYPQIHNDALDVLRNLVFKEKSVTTHDGRWFDVRIMPYRTFDDKIDGLVITFIDITKAKQLENALMDSQMMLRSFIHAVPGVIMGLTSEGKIIEYNSEAEKLFGYKHDRVMGNNYIDLFIPESLRADVKKDLKKIFSGTIPDHFVNLIKTMNGEILKIEWSAHKLKDKHGMLAGIIIIGIKIIDHETLMIP